MIRFLLLGMFIFFTATASAKAEIQIFMNYRGTNAYDYKIVSTPDMPLSAWYVLPGSHNAACFMGPPNEALALFQTMVGIYNTEYERHIRADGYPAYDVDTNQTYLVINEIDEAGHPWGWFPRMDECVSWSVANLRGL